MGVALGYQGIVVNHKKIRRLMRKHGLQPKIRRRYVATTHSDHDGPIFPNRARDMALDGPNRLWVSDITYVAIAAGFVYVAVILDAWSRRVVGYAIGRSIDATGDWPQIHGVLVWDLHEWYHGCEVPGARSWQHPEDLLLANGGNSVQGHLLGFPGYDGYTVLSQLADTYELGGLPAGIRVVRAISRVTLQVFAPLKAKITQRES
jgi:hypothetical protein